MTSVEELAVGVVFCSSDPAGGERSSRWLGGFVALMVRVLNRVAVLCQGSLEQPNDAKHNQKVQERE